MKLATDIEATQNDDMHRAIEESLAYAGSVDDIHEELSPEDRIRKDHRLVLVHSSDREADTTSLVPSYCVRKTTRFLTSAYSGKRYSTSHKSASILLHTVDLLPTLWFQTEMENSK